MAKACAWCGEPCVSYAKYHRRILVKTGFHQMEEVCKPECAEALRRFHSGLTPAEQVRQMCKGK